MALLKNWDITFPAIGGIVLCIRRVATERTAVLPLAWTTYTLLLFGLHRPWWNYYYIHTAIPLCWCAAIGINALWANARWPQAKVCCVLLALYVQCAGAWLIERLYLEVQSVRLSPQTFTCPFLKTLDRFRDTARWLYTEEPVYSFYANIPMPPDLAVVVLKRYWSGEMTPKRLVDDLRFYKPELMLLKNDSNPRPFHDLVDQEYRLIYIDSDNLLYVRKSVPHLFKH
jgi:hypothetical protein